MSLINKEKYKDYLLEDIYSKKVNYYDKILDYWLRNKLLDFEEAKKRLKEVAIVFLKKDLVVGVITLAKIKYQNKNYFYLRISIGKKHRGTKLWLSGINMLLKNFKKRKKNSQIFEKGIVIELGNSKLSSSTITEKIFPLYNLTLDGYSKNKSQVWRYEF